MLTGFGVAILGRELRLFCPSKAYAKISMRLVPNQSSEHITKLFTDYFMAAAPKGVQVTVTPHHGGEAYLMPTDSIAFQAASEALATTFGKVPVPTRGGGSIPIVALFVYFNGFWFRF
jgi:acetylornithine deacetylase/succinyl-diaminopimelate desuccinylase-like protein